MKSIFTYTNYRAFLSDYFDDRKERDTNFSHRYLAQRAGFSTSNFVHLVIKGKRNLTKSSAMKIAIALKLDNKEADYFENLVFYNQSSSIKEKGILFTKLNAARKSLFAKEITKDQFEYYSSWIHPVIREIACYIEGPASGHSVAKRLRPRITPAAAQKSLDLLCRLGLLIKETEGGYTQTDKLIETPAEVASLAVSNYHVQTMALAAESIDRFKAEKRDISSVTLGITKENAKRIKERIIAFRRELLQMADEENPDCVYQINFQLFPMSDVEERT